MITENYRMIKRLYTNYGSEPLGELHKHALVRAIGESNVLFFTRREPS